MARKVVAPAACIWRAMGSTLTAKYDHLARSAGPFVSPLADIDGGRAVAPLRAPWPRPGPRMAQERCL
jgi:hypothetical protein